MDEIDIDALERQLSHNPDCQIEGEVVWQLLTLLKKREKERDDAQSQLQLLERFYDFIEA